jgi:hypothetical protein
MKKRTTHKPYSTAFLLIIFSVSLVLGSYLFPMIKSMLESQRKPSTEQAAQNIYKICSQPKNKQTPDKSQCYPKEFYKITMQKDVKFAYDTIFELQKIDNYANSCHLIAHGIGWAAYEKDPKNFQKTHAEIPKTCNFGAIHGIFERYTSTNKVSLFDKKTLLELCNPKQSACIHILGHLLVVETGNNLEQSKEFCSSFPTTNENRSDCLQGAYMEHMIGPNLFNHGLITAERRNNWALRIDDFEKLCRAQNGENAVACWGIISMAANLYYNKDFQKIFEFCSTAQANEAAAYCRRVAVGITSSTWTRNLNEYDACDLLQPNDPTFKKDCLVIQVNSTMANISAKNTKRVADFCSSLPIAEKTICFQTIDSSIKRLSFTQSQKEQVCKNIPMEYKNICRNNIKAEDREMKNEIAGLEKEMINDN